MKKLLIGIVGLIVLAIIAVVIYLAFVRADAPAEFGLTEATEQAEDTEDTESAETDTGDIEADSGDTGQVELDGIWSVAAGSEAGYRVVEDLGGIADFEAVGRTSTVTGSIDVAGTTITAGSFEVDIATITSDDGRRDNQFRGQIMNAAEFPNATLVLTGPIDIGSAPADGTTIEATATGDLTLRGSTNPVSFPIRAQLLDGQIELVGSIDVLFSDYEIANPSNSLVSVRDEGKVEVRLLLEKA